MAGSLLLKAAFLAQGSHRLSIRPNLLDRSDRRTRYDMGMFPRRQVRFRRSARQNWHCQFTLQA
jgi:hypothetical protein